MTWAVVTDASYLAWRATTDEDRDGLLRIVVLEWVIGLQSSGPPPDAVRSADGLWEALIPRTAVMVRYLVFEGAYPPAIVIREYLGPS